MLILAVTPFGTDVAGQVGGTPGNTSIYLVTVGHGAESAGNEFAELRVESKCSEVAQRTLVWNKDRASRLIVWVLLPLSDGIRQWENKAKAVVLVWGLARCRRRRRLRHR